MRLFIFNNDRLKYVFVQAYTGQDTLWEVFEDKINSQNINIGPGNTPDAKKVLLWATAKRTMLHVKFDTSKADFGIPQKTKPVSYLPKENQYGRTVNNKTSPTSGYDFFLDRGTGWCSLVKNYDVYREIDDSGNIPNKHDYMSVMKTPPWLDYTNKFLGFTTSGSTQFASLLLSGNTSIIPFGIGSFYGEPKAMTKDNFQNIARLSSVISNTVRAVIFVEWPAVAFDKSYTEWFNSSVVTIPDKQAIANKLREDMLAEEPLKTQAGSNDQSHLGQAQYLMKLQYLDNYLAASYRQMDKLTSSRNFDDQTLDKAWYQTFYSGVLFTLSKAVQIMGNVIGVGVGTLPIPSDIAGPVITDPAKELFTTLSTYIDHKRMLYNNGGQPEGIQVAIENILETLNISYTAYELFLLKWGIAEKVTGRPDAKIEAKIKKLNADMTKKVKQQTLITTG